MRKKVKIAKTDYEALPFVLGGNVFGWTADPKASFDILDKFVEEGFQMIDTANSYSYWAEGNKGGESEQIIGNWIKKRGKRDDLIIATKVGGQIPGTQHSLKPEYIREQVEKSLTRLNTDYIDIYYSHYDDVNTPVKDTLSAYAELIKEGKVRYIATSNMSPERVRESMQVSNELNIPSYIAIQPEYNLFDREGYEKNYQTLAKEFGLSVFPYFALASGFLTGKYETIEDVKKSNRASMLDGYVSERGDKILKALREVANRYEATYAQVALAWLLANPSITAPIASVSKVMQLDILKAVDIKLEKDAVDKLNKASEY